MSFTSRAGKHNTPIAQQMRPFRHCRHVHTQSKGRVYATGSQHLCPSQLLSWPLQQGPNTSAQVSSCPGLCSSPHTWPGVLVKARLSFTQLDAHHRCPKRSLALYCPVHSPNGISGSYQESPGSSRCLSTAQSCSAPWPWSTAYVTPNPTKPRGGINPPSFKDSGSQHCPPTHSWFSVGTLRVTGVKFASRGCYLSGLVLTESKQNREKG